MSDRFLVVDEVHTLVEAAVGCDLVRAEARDILLGNLPAMFKARLEHKSVPLFQVQSDLIALNEVIELDDWDQGPPLAHWLANAAYNSRYRGKTKDSGLFAEARVRVQETARALAAGEPPPGRILPESLKLELRLERASDPFDEDWLRDLIKKLGVNVSDLRLVGTRPGSVIVDFDGPLGKVLPVIRALRAPSPELDRFVRQARLLDASWGDGDWRVPIHVGGRVTALLAGGAVGALGVAAVTWGTASGLAATGLAVGLAFTLLMPSAPPPAPADAVVETVVDAARDAEPRDAAPAPPACPDGQVCRPTQAVDAEWARRQRVFRTCETETRARVSKARAGLLKALSEAVGERQAKADEATFDFPKGLVEYPEKTFALELVPGHFGSCGTAIDDATKARLEAVARVFADGPDRTVRRLVVVGHTDASPVQSGCAYVDPINGAKGTLYDNEMLSMHRARMVAHVLRPILAEKTISVSAIGLGDLEPLPCEQAESVEALEGKGPCAHRARRVELRVLSGPELTLDLTPCWQRAYGEPDGD